MRRPAYPSLWLVIGLVASLGLGCVRGASSADASGAASGADGTGTGSAGADGASGAACGDAHCSVGELCRVLYQGTGTPAAGPVEPTSRCVAIPVACQGHATCACP